MRQFAQYNYFHLFINYNKLKHIFHFYYMSILQEDDNNFNDLRRCKIDYLQAENDWMQRQYDFLSSLIQDYKRIIQLSQHSDQAHKAEIQHVNQNINTALLKQIESYSQTKQRALEIKEQITVEQFLPLVMSFEEKIRRLQSDIKDRETQLQIIEQRKAKEEEGLSEKKIESKNFNSYDIHSKMLDRIKREVVRLKIKKKKLQNQLIAAKEHTEESAQSTGISDTKTGENYAPRSVESEQMSTFQKVVMLLKKKRYQNDCMEDRIKKMKIKIAEKKEVSERLKKQINNMEWRCIQNIEYGNGYIETHNDGDLSMVGKSCYNNAQFSFDISRFIKPRLNS